MTNVNQNQESQKKLTNNFFARVRKFTQANCSSKPFIAAIFFAFGIASVLLTQGLLQNTPPRISHQNLLPSFSNMAFAHNDIFSEMEEMEKVMHESFIAHQKMMQKAFANIEKSNDTKFTSRVSNSSDNNNYYYQLDFSGFKKEEILVSVKDNVVSFSAKSSETKSSEDSSSNASTQFHYSFLAPEYDHKSDPEIIKKDNQIIVRLAKKK